MCQTEENGGVIREGRKLKIDIGKSLSSIQLALKIPDLKLDRVISSFDGENCPRLIGKPKIFMNSVPYASDFGGQHMTDLFRTRRQGPEYNCSSKSFSPNNHA